MSLYIYKNHKIKKKFGQNFLFNKDDILSIINVIKPKYDDIMVEIGPGLGALTKVMSCYVDELTVIEIDKDLVNMLLCMDLFKKNVIILEMDVRKFDFYSLYYKKKKLLRIFGSLPYNNAMSIILYLSKYRNFVHDMYFVLQKEIAYRLAAKPNSKFYGKLSIIIQYYYNVFLFFDIHPSSFKPSPKVYSIVVRFVPLIFPDVFVENLNNFNNLLNCVFSYRRKILKNSLCRFFTIEELKKIKINIFSRAENLSVKDFCLLSNYISDKTKI
ncbi:MAG: 16S rRNA m(6)2A1518,m(6)2A1519 dimethyltransferase [Candidatus Westeberhardia cardiocondylae]|nr:16S rRNA m(6)2A1518,m(6)2A1519 dimethyltransferase [Candidatus Westeberhardia cardiocondylae]